MNLQHISLTASELKAIEDHKHYLSQRRGVEVTIEDAIRDFLVHYAAAWRREKMRRDNDEQRQEIEKHKWLLSEKEGRDVGRAVAAHEWCERFAHVWRAERESLERNGFLRTTVAVTTEHFHLRPASALTQLAEEFACEIYVHKPGMSCCNFVLQGKTYVNVKSILTLMSLGVARGDELEFLLTGLQAGDVLKKIALVVNQAE